MADETGYDNGVDEELRGIFFEESREQLEILDQGLVRLEQEPGNTALIQGIFRAAHTLKGSSGAMGFRQMAELTHAMEDVLDRVRQGTLAVTTAVADALLHGLDLLRSMEQDLAAGGTGYPEGEARQREIVDLLHAIASGEGMATAATVAAPPVLMPALPADQTAVLLHVADDSAMPNIRLFMALRALDDLATLHESQPTREEIDAGYEGRRLLVTLSSELPDEELRTAVMRVGEVEWVRIAHGAGAAGMHLEMPAREDLGVASRAEGTEKREAATGAVPAPSTVRVSVEMLDKILNLVGELVLDRTRVAQLKDELVASKQFDDLANDLDAVSQHLGSIVAELHESVLQARMLPVSQLFNRFPRLVRDLCRTLGKEVDLLVEGENEQLDRSVIERLVDPLTHIMRNSTDHGMESPAQREAMGKSRRGAIVLSARREEGHVVIQVSDDGPGINVERIKDKAVANGILSPERVKTISREEALQLIFAAGLTTATEVSDVSGRGVGMDVVKRNVESLGGSIAIISEMGMGTTVALKIPLTLAIVRGLIVRVGEVAITIPLSFIEETIKVDRQHVGTVHGHPVLQWRGSVAPIVDLNEVMPGCGARETHRFMHLIVVRYATRIVCFAVDAIVGHQEIVVKSLGDYLGDVRGLAGATILGNGRVALILDVGRLFESGMLHSAILDAEFSSEADDTAMALSYN